MPKKIKRYETKDNWSSKDAKYYYPVFNEHKDGEWVKTSDLIEAIREENEAWIIKMLKLRDLINLSDSENIIDEIYHEIYSFVDPTFCKGDPWKEWEAIRSRSNS